MAKPYIPRGLTQHHSNSSWRYTPTAARRAQGWVSVTFKNADGTLMTFGQSVDAANAINALIDDYDAGLSIAGRPWAHLNPRAAAGEARAQAEAKDSIGFLIDAYMGARDPLTRQWSGGSDKFKTLSESSQIDARGRLGRLVETLSGYKDGAPSPRELPAEAYDKAKARYDAAILALRQTPITGLVPPLPKKGEARIKGPLEVAYGSLAATVNERTGKPMVTNAAAIMRYTSMWLSWVKKEHGWIERNPVADIDVAIPEGRIVVWSQEEIDRVIKAAHDMGWHSVAFAVELALELSWSQTDILKARWCDIDEDLIIGTRSKTRVKTETGFTKAGIDLLNRIRAHYAKGDGKNIHALPTQHIIRVDRRYGNERVGSVGQAWNKGYFRHIFMEVRDEAFKDHPEDRKTFQDFRDTAITRMYKAGMSYSEIATRTQHSLTHIQAVIEKHYGKLDREIARSAARKMDAYYATKGIFSA